MPRMIQKIIKVGSSAAVTIPKRALEELNLRIGDPITVATSKKEKRVTIEPIARVDSELVKWADKFIEAYGATLKALAKK